MLKSLDHVGSPRARILSDVVCGVNGSRGSYEAVRQAAALAGANARLTLVAVTAVRGSGPQRTASIAPPRARRALLYARRLAVEAGVTNVAVEIDDGYPVLETLLGHAEGHGLFAIGAPFMSRVAHLLVGGTATQRRMCCQPRSWSSGERRRASDSPNASSLRVMAVRRPTASLIWPPNSRLIATLHWCWCTRSVETHQTSWQRSTGRPSAP